MKFKKIIATIMVATLGLTTACNNGGGSGDEIVIGAVGPTTGGAAIYGNSVFEGVELAIEQFGDINGKKIVFKQYDDKAEPPEAINAYNRLIENDKVVAVIGGITSGSTAAIVEASKSNNTPLITPSATDDSITTLGDNIYRACFRDSYQGEVMAKFAYNSLGVKKAAVIYNNSIDYSVGLQASFIETFEKLGGEVVATEAYSNTDSDFRVQLDKIQKASPEILFAPDYYEKISLLTKQVYDMGFDIPLLGADGWDGVLELVSDNVEVLNNSYICKSFSPEDQSEGVQDFITKYTEKYNKVPNGFCASGYDATMILLNAIKVCDDNGTLTNEAILAQLAKTEIEGVDGIIKFDSGRNAIKGAVVIEYKDGVEVIADKIEG